MNFIMSVLLFFMPLSINASSTNTIFKDNYFAYDFTNSYTKNELDEINEHAKKFTKISDIGLVVIIVENKTVDDNYGYLLYDGNLLTDDHRGKVIIFVNIAEKEISIRSFGLDHFENVFLYHFKEYMYNVKGGHTIVDYIDLLYKYFYKKNIGYLIFSITISIILTGIIVRFVKNKYRIVNLKHANMYNNVLPHYKKIDDEE